MSTPTTDMARSSFSTAAFAQLVRRLRHTNARYNQIARQFRCRLRPTYHAKRRAYRAGLRIDISKARALPRKYVSDKPPAIPDTSPVIPGREEDAYTRGPALRNLPDVVARKHRRHDGRQRIMLRLPPLRLHLDYACGVPFQGPVPGAPRLLPRQLPDDESGVEEMTLGSSSLSESFLTPPDVRAYSGLCITIPPRGVKRKLQDVDADGYNVPSQQQPKRVFKARWNDSHKQ